ncbi:hypothetical protein RQ479_28035 [Mesorhizobium sp. ISC25]|uniref:hypothetical protein n=1 Tax=Mesorhizobium sp. ISC25 TaxID=3077335 RepID=UPI0035E0F9A4
MTAGSTVVRKVIRAMLRARLAVSSPGELPATLNAVAPQLVLYLNADLDVPENHLVAE